jgi:hypothetical protein
MLAREFRRTLPNLYLCAKTHFAKMDTPWAPPAAKVVAADMERGGSAAASDQLQLESRAAVLSQAGAPLSWTNERSE